MPPMPGMGPGEPPAFNPQMVQQLAIMLQNPNLPMPMRMQLQMQMQMQQMLFFQMFPPGSAPPMPGMPGMPPMPGGPGGPPPPGPSQEAETGQRRRHNDAGGRESKAARRRG